MIRPLVKMVRGRAGHSGPDATASVSVTVRDSIAGDLRAVVTISEGGDGITRITVTPGDACDATVNGVETTRELVARARRT